MIGMAVIGVGWAGKRQVQAAAELGEKIKVVALADNDPIHLAQSAAELGIARTYADYRAPLADDAVDAVSICTPHALHRPMALAAAEAGKHILVEKPMALTVEDATAMIHAAEANDVKLYVAENWVYSPMTRFMRGVLSAGAHIGELTAASYVWGFQAQNFGYPGRRAWLAQPERGGSGSWMLHGIHSMARLRHILGEVTTVYLREFHNSRFQRTDLEGTVSGLFTLESGAHLSILHSCELRLKGRNAGLTLHGDRGSIYAGPDGYVVSGADAGGAEIMQEYPAQRLSDYALELAAFADYINGTGAGPTSGYSERRTLAIVQAGYESMRSGLPVDLAARFGEL